MMKVTDMHGQAIEVTDLNAAIEQAAGYKDSHHDPPKPIADSRQQAYWTDIYEKLIQLREQQKQ